ncbi:hypothetical protein DFH06DRAFT_1297325 [Mycena polygramma]|nr:hypothetical protein DFH06DRAFT_1297325 [Mycena polygramma]
MPYEAPTVAFAPATARERITSIDAEMSNLPQSKVLDLSLERSALQLHLDAYIYPVSTLPNEVVSEVFLHTLPTWDLYADPLNRGLQSSLLLGGICRKWREISISTPSLWTRIEIWLDNVASHDNKLRLLDIWLTRSRACPLFITIMADGRLDARDRFSCRAFVEAIVPHCGRWDTLHLTVPFRDLPLLRGKWPMLRELALDILDVDEEALAPVHVFDPAPKLTNIMILPTLSPHRIVFPWTQLTLLSLHVESADRLLEVLPLIVNVASLVIAIRCFDEHPPQYIPDIPPLLSLHALRVQGSYPIDSTIFVRLFQKLTLPKLRRLQAYTPSLPPPAIADLLARSGCLLWSFRLSIQNSTFGYDDYRRAMPTVGKIVFEELGYEPGSEGLDSSDLWSTSDSADGEESEGDGSDEEEQSSDDDG